MAKARLRVRIESGSCLFWPSALDPLEMFTHLSDGRVATSKAFSALNSIKAL